METTSVSSEDEPVGGRTVAVVRTEEEYAALDVFGTEAFDSVCGVGILDPFYRPDVKRVISLWTVLLLVGTTVLILGFFGCFRRMKGENLDLSRNLWNEDLFWTSLFHFMLTCFAVTCGLSALASHTNLHSHAKVLGFRRVFRWCLTLHAAAAVFTLVVAFKLTVVDFLEPEGGATLTAKKKTLELIADNRDLKGPKDVYVYPRGPHTANSVTSSSLSPMGFSLLQITTASSNVPKSTENAETTKVASSSVVTTRAPDHSIFDGRSMRHSTTLTDFLQRMSGRSGEAVWPLHGMSFDSSLQWQDFTRKGAFRRAHHWKGNEDSPRVAVLHSNAAREAKPCPTSILQSKGGFERDYSRALTPEFTNPCVYADTSASLGGNGSSAEAASSQARPLTPAYKGDRHSFVSHAAGSNFLPVLHEHEPRQKSRAVAQLSSHRDAPSSESKSHSAAQFTSSPKCVFIDVKSGERISATTHRRNVVSDALVGQATALPPAGIFRRIYGKTDPESSTGDQHQHQAHVSFFLEGYSEEPGRLADGSAAPEVKNELHPVRDSRVYRIMLYLVVPLDYAAAVLHVICFMYTWHLASKIGGMFGLKILKIPF